MNFTWLPTENIDFYQNFFLFRPTDLKCEYIEMILMSDVLIKNIHHFLRSNHHSKTIIIECSSHH